MNKYLYERLHDLLSYMYMVVPVRTQGCPLLDTEDHTGEDCVPDPGEALCPETHQDLAP